MDPFPFFPYVKKNAANVAIKKVGTNTKCNTGIKTEITAIKKQAAALVRAEVRRTDLEKYLTLAEPNEFFPLGPIIKSFISWSISGSYFPEADGFS